MSSLSVQVAHIRSLTALVRELRLEPLRGLLPAFSAGSHVQVHLPNGKRNAYSLLSDPADTSHYRIAVRLQAQSRGGSRYIHERLQIGDLLQLSEPANLFPIHSQARLHLLVAGGIGITPFLAYCAELLRKDARFELHYAYRGESGDAYVDELQESLGTRLHRYRSGQRRLDLAQLLRARPLGTHVYACGPHSLLDSLHQQIRALGWSERRLHREAFSSAAAGLPFTVELARSGRRLEVAAEQSLLEALEAAGVERPNLCRGGVCGQCQTTYLRGDVEHRDLFLAAEERANSLMPCVSRGCGKPILLDL
jgi:ferredoxin-NADP reductase